MNFNNWNKREFYISYQLSSNITVGTTTQISLVVGKEQTINGSIYDVATGNYVNTGNTQLTTLILSLPSGIIVKNAIVTINGTNYPDSVVGNEILISGFELYRGASLSITVYYQTTTVSSSQSGFNVLFTYHIGIFNLFDVLVAFYIVSWSFILDFSRRYTHKKGKSRFTIPPEAVKYEALLYFVGVILFFLQFLYLAGY
jgi:hypothetical protein